MTISIADVQRAVARAFNLSVAELVSRERRQRVACARHVAMYLSRTLVGGERRVGARAGRASFPRIGIAFARDHTSVIHACNEVGRRLRRDRGFSRLLDQIAEQVRREGLRQRGGSDALRERLSAARPAGVRQARALRSSPR